MTRKHYLNIGLVMSALALSPIAYADMPVIDLSNLTQNSASAAHTLTTTYDDTTMIDNQVESLKNEATMLKNSNIHQLSDVTGDINDVESMAAQGNAITYSSADVSSKFDQTFGSSDKSNPNAIDKINQQLSASLDTARGTLTATNKQMQYTSQASSGMDTIVDGSNSAGGTKAVLQGTNQMLDAVAAQTQYTNQELAQGFSQNATFQSQQIAIQQAAYQTDSQMMNYTVDYHGYETNDDLNSMPDFSD